MDCWLYMRLHMLLNIAHTLPSYNFKYNRFDHAVKGTSNNGKGALRPSQILWNLAV